MPGRATSLRIPVALAVAQLILATTAWAHHPTITASAVCEVDGVVINFTSTSWSTDLDGQNSQVNILINGVFHGSGAYGPAVFSFSGSAPAPASAGPGDMVSVTAVAAADWGDGVEGGQTAGVSATIPTEPCNQPGLGRFTGGGNQIRVDGVRVTRGLTIHCDLLLSNNLEVNWQGNSFHTTEHLTTVSCTDDPNIIQAPPPAPIDTLVGIGTGRYNNQDGFTIEFTLVDAGEPGRDDMARIYIFETANPANVVLDVPLQLLDHGNLQAHYDQPHR